MVRWVALFWGFVAFFPIGLNYTAFVLLGVAMAWEGGLGERLARLRQTPYWWPAWAFLGWAALALVRSIAGRHQGTVHCEGNPQGQGACFVLRLPITPLA